MAAEIEELLVLPPLAIGRLGSSPDPMDNYDLVDNDPVGPRRIVPAETITVDRETGVPERTMPKEVRFRDKEGRIRPVSPFLEVWVRLNGEPDLTPLTAAVLKSLNPAPDAVRWRVLVANLKIFRHTRDTNDRIEADTDWFSDHKVHELSGSCPNFVDGKTLPLGSVQFIAPTDKLPEIRLRFTPAGGHVYGPKPATGTDPNISKTVFYDDSKGHWKGYKEPGDQNSNLLTNPGQIFAGEADGIGKNRKIVSWGYFDDECDGIVDVELQPKEGTKVCGYARIAAGPPTFAPDSTPVRTVADELEQAMYGPRFDEPATEAELAEVREIVRHSLETVRLINTGQMNKASLDRGVGMARMDAGLNRALEPIFEPSVADSLAIRARHERVLLGLESGSLVWFARILREYDEVGDLSTEGRRKMPALMRGADGQHLALTRRQVAKIRAAAKYVTSQSGAE